MKFEKTYRLLMEQLEESGFRLSTSDLYNFYYLFTLMTQNQVKGEYAEYVAKDFLNRMKNKYLVLFKELLYVQIRKYISRRRVDADVTMEELDKNRDSTSGLLELMKKTYRSDMRRRNDVWNMVAEYVNGLDGARLPDRIGYYIDRINNCVHNTGEIILSKFSNYSELMRVFEEIHHANNLEAYKRKVSKDIREIG